jgi:hypothetical protein
VDLIAYGIGKIVPIKSMRERVMTKKSKPVCMECNSNEALYITLSNGKRLPSYTIKIGVGIVCNGCKKAKEVA